MLDTSNSAVVALQAWRTRHMVTQATAADMLGVPLRTLQHWELTGRCALPGLLTLALRFLNGDCLRAPEGRESSTTAGRPEGPTEGKRGGYVPLPARDVA